ncbi:Acyl-coenzyme A thioesterase 13 [Coemansia sp. Benny D115]|nr:Acyl-coenzyme A thioesterase 13 [Coemansia sp. Benny D115]
METDLVAAINDAYKLVNSYLHYGMEIVPRVTWASKKTGELIAEWQVTADHLGTAGTIDEGVLGTVTDNTSAMLIGVMLPGGKSVSTSISVQGVSPIPSTGALVEIVCRLTNSDVRQPHATVTFRDKLNGTVYAIVSIQPTGYKNDRLTSAKVTYQITIAPTDCNTWGTIHGGCVFTLCNAVGKIATAVVAPNAKNIVSTDLTTNYLSGAKVGSTVTIEIECLRTTKSIGFLRGSIKDAAGSLCYVCVQNVSFELED